MFEQTFKNIVKVQGSGHCGNTRCEAELDQERVGI